MWFYIAVPSLMTLKECRGCKSLFTFVTSIVLFSSVFGVHVVNKEAFFQKSLPTQLTNVILLSMRVIHVKSKTSLVLEIFSTYLANWSLSVAFQVLIQGLLSHRDAFVHGVWKEYSSAHLRSTGDGAHIAEEALWVFSVEDQMTFNLLFRWEPFPTGGARMDPKGVD